MPEQLAPFLCLVLVSPKTIRPDVVLKPLQETTADAERYKERLEQAEHRLKEGESSTLAAEFNRKKLSCPWVEFDSKNLTNMCITKVVSEGCGR